VNQSVGLWEEASETAGDVLLRAIIEEGLMCLNDGCDLERVVAEVEKRTGRISEEGGE
jgi:hypothetical protein